jgi:hypothetical protein
MRRVRRNDRQSTRITSGDLVVETIVQAVARANGAALEQAFQFFHSLFEQPLVQQRKVRWFDVCRFFVH